MLEHSMIGEARATIESNPREINAVPFPTMPVRRLDSIRIPVMISSMGMDMDLLVAITDQGGQTVVGMAHLGGIMDQQAHLGLDLVGTDQVVDAPLGHVVEALVVTDQVEGALEEVDLLEIPTDGQVVALEAVELLVEAMDRLLEVVKDQRVVVNNPDLDVARTSRDQAEAVTVDPIKARRAEVDSVNIYFCIELS